MLITSVLLLLFNVFFLMWNNIQKARPEFVKSSIDQQKFTQDDDGNQKKIKSILLWNGPKRAETLLFGAGREVFRQHGCEVTDCELVLNREQFPSIDYPLATYDAIVFNANNDYPIIEVPTPEERNLSQRYVFLTQESPGVLLNLNSLANKLMFNWTMTYRRNSDITFLYGQIIPKATAPKTPSEISSLIEESSNNQRTFNTKKTKLVAWMVSKCNTYSRREKYVKELRKYIPVDIYGKCGKLKCQPDDLLSSHPKCYKMLESNYKFYLSFENSLCRDYVTEKFFNIISRNIVPVVFGGANYTKIAPQHSFIDARKYQPRQLANYLKMLDKNETLYNQYFWWKEYYTVKSGIAQMARQGFCDLCKKLHQNQRVKTFSARTLTSKWNPEFVCSQHSALFMI